MQEKVRILYKTENMLEPQLRYLFNKETKEVACMITFTPTFEPIYP